MSFTETEDDREFFEDDDLETLNRNEADDYRNEGLDEDDSEESDESDEDDWDAEDDESEDPDWD